MRFRETLYRLFYGRYITYGIDKLTYFLIGVCVFLSLISIILSSGILSLLETLLFFYMLFRLFSRNIVKRQNENRKYVDFLNRFKSKFSLEKRKFKERESHIYKTCPHCRVTLRLPRRSGTHTVCCPKCKNNFSVKVR